MSTFVVRPNDRVLARFASLYGTTADQRLRSLAAALVTSPPWSRLAAGSNTCIAVRTQPRPILAVVGRFTDVDRPALEALDWQVSDALERLLPVSYAQVEAACRELAGELRVRIGHERLRACRLVAVPRGGLIVAGLLSYSLGLSRDQLTHRPSVEAETIVVDDCMLSGARTRQWLRGHDGPPVILAHLHSHPTVREAVERDHRVAACVAAADLRDHAPALHGAGYDAWRTAWRKRSPDDFWTGHPDHVCYPWNEPDTSFWDHVSGTAAAGWHVVPPDWCVKNRTTQRAADIQACSSRHVPPDVVWAFHDEMVVLADTARGRSLELSGTGVDLWRELVDSGQVARCSQLLAARYDVDVAVVHADLADLAARLRADGWWEPDSVS